MQQVQPAASVSVCRVLPTMCTIDYIVVIMGDKTMLGEFELMVMLAVTRLDEGAFAVPIRRLIELEAARDVSRGALYTTLERLEGKGFLASSLGEPLPERGGRARRYYGVTRQGREALERTRVALANLWRGVAPLTEEAG